MKQWTEEDVDSIDETLVQAIDIILPFVDQSLRQLDPIRSHSATLAE